MPLPDQQGMRFVKHYIKNNDECLLIVKRRSEVPFSIIDSVFTRYGLPLELKYLAVIESELKTSAVSRVGAKGPWQLMPGTAQELGLKVNRHSDERVNYYKSTRAAAKYLRDLHREFGDWLLVLAAYNGGPLPVIRAIHKSHSRNFWTLQRYLPAESRDHVKKFIATAWYFEGADTVTRPQSLPTASNLPNRLTPDNKPQTTPESADEKFNRLMRESANSLRTSHELLTL
jgi:membrane-bound lytic murein transglycosylase D